jgi:spermidine synthase
MREVVRGVVCWLAMFPPAVLIGAIYPIAMECIGRANPTRAIRSLGQAAALNTVGNIAGVLIGGFVLLPYLGAMRSIQLLAVVCMLLGAITLWQAGATRRWIGWVPAGIALAMLILQPSSFDYTKLSMGSNVYFSPQQWGKVIDHAESTDGGLTSVTLREEPGLPPLRTLLTNGKFQGNDSNEGEMRAQIGFALAPLLHIPHRNDALVIGYGTGASSRVIQEAGFAKLDIVELSADIVRMANKHFPGINGGVTERNGVKTHITDGRNFLLLQSGRYDLIGMEISSIWFAGAASLYNREFYALAKQRLQPHGVLQQWMQLHHVTPLDVTRILASIRSEFKFVWLYLIGGQGIIVASNDQSAAPTAHNIELLRRTSSLQPILGILGTDPIGLLDALLLDPSGTDKLLTSFGLPIAYWISTDDNLRLEYDTPKGNAFDSAKSFIGNVNFIKKFADPKVLRTLR